MEIEEPQKDKQTKDDGPQENNDQKQGNEGNEDEYKKGETLREPAQTESKETEETKEKGKTQKLEESREEVKLKEEEVTREGETEKEKDVEEDPGTDDDKDDDKKDDHMDTEYVEPILDGRYITFKTKILNPQLLCSLCCGYFREAHTIKECLHTFCKCCIYKHFHEKRDCPLCGVDLGPLPFDKIKYDRTLQELLNKIFPQVVASDLAAEEKFYQERNIDMISYKAQFQQMMEIATSKRKAQLQQPSGSKGDSLAESAMSANNPSSAAAGKINNSDQISFQLICDEENSTGGIRKLEKPYICTSAKATINHLKKFLMLKLGLEKTLEMEIMFQGEVLGTEHSLEYILKTRNVALNSAPVFYYRTRNLYLS